MTLLAYTLLLVLMLLCSMAVHELSHLAVARWTRVKASGFQMGCGWKIISRYSGRTPVRISDRTENLRPDWPGPERGQLVGMYVDRENGESQYTAQAMFPIDRKPFPEEKLEAIRENSLTRMQLRGRVVEAGPERVILADMAWTLKAFPIMAGVILVDDPGCRMPEAYNVASWTRQTAITAAGPLANILTCALILTIIAVFPMLGTKAAELRVTHTMPGSPADHAGIRAGDRIVRAGNLLHPDAQEVREHIRGTADRDREADLGLVRGERGWSIRVRPDPSTRKIGVRLEMVAQPSRDHRMDPVSIARRMLSIGERYGRSIRDMAASAASRETGAAGSPGPIVGTHQMAEAAEHTGAAGMLVIMATLNLIIAASNLLPIPRQDGYLILTGAIQALRGGRPISRRAEAAMMVGWIALIVFLATYLVVSDVSRLLGLRG